MGVKCLACGEVCSGELDSFCGDACREAHGKEVREWYDTKVLTAGGGWRTLALLSLVAVVVTVLAGWWWLALSLYVVGNFCYFRSHAARMRVSPVTEGFLDYRPRVRAVRSALWPVVFIVDVVTHTKATG